MSEWWATLDGVTRGFYLAATVFSVIFLWQLLAAIIGLSGSEDVDLDADAADAADVDVDAVDADADVHLDAAQSMAAFKLLSLRSIVAFCTLFSWAGALYLNQGVLITRSLLYAMLWGVLAMIAVAAIFYVMRRMTETGSRRIASCLGSEGTVYLHIPANAVGEARVVVSGALSHVKARGAGGQEIKAGTRIRVARILGPSTVEVEPIEKE